MARKVTSSLDIPMDNDSSSSTNDDAQDTASQIQIILASDHTVRKSSLKPKAEEELQGQEIRDISKSVKWREAKSLEQVLLIAPRSNIMEELMTSSLSIDDDDIDGRPLLRDSSVDLTTFQSLKPDFDLKEFPALGHTHPEFSSKDSSPDDFSSDDDDNVQKTFGVEAYGDIKTASPDLSTTEDDIIVVAAIKENFHSKTSDSDNITTQVPKKNPEIQATKKLPQGPLANLIKTLNKTPRKVNQGSPSPSSLSGTQGKTAKAPANRTFTKPTIRYTVPPFDYDGNSSFLEVQESFCSVDSEFLNHENTKFGKGKFYVLYTEDTDYNFLCLDELFKEIYRSLRFGSKMPSERTTASMIDDLQTDFKPAVVDAPPGFLPGREADWMDLGIKLSMVKYKKVKEVASVIPLTDLNFKEFIIPGDRIGPLENYMLVNENFLKDMKHSSLDDMIASPFDITPNDFMTKTIMNDPANQLKILSGSPYRFPKLVIPSHTPHPEVARLRQTNVHVVMEKKRNPPPASPVPELKPLVKKPVNVETLFKKPIPHTQITHLHDSKTGVPKVKRYMLTKSRAKTNFSVSPDTTSEGTDDNTDPATLRKRESLPPRKIATILKYRPLAADYSTFVKSTHWNPIPQIVTKQTKMSLFKQILTEEDVIANTNALQRNSSYQSQSRPMLTVPSTLYADLQEHNNTIVLTRDDVLELIGGHPEVPKYYKSSLFPGIYVPCPQTPYSNPPSPYTPQYKEMLQCKRRTSFNLPGSKERSRKMSARIANSFSRK